MDFVHCNVCAKAVNSENREIGQREVFVVTSCGHILCATCVRKGNGASGRIAMCPYDPCSQNNVKFVKISNKLDPEVRRYFTQVDVLIQNYAVKVQEVAQFQKMHSDIYTKFQQDERRQMRQNLLQLQEENRNLRIHLDNITNSHASYPSYDKRQPLYPSNMNQHSMNQRRYIQPPPQKHTIVPKTTSTPRNFRHDHSYLICSSQSQSAPNPISMEGPIRRPIGPVFKSPRTALVGSGRQQPYPIPDTVLTTDARIHDSVPLTPVSQDSSGNYHSLPIHTPMISQRMMNMITD